ncbi:MAG: site-specific DNA-methyltransferase, partial [Clostridiales Family XIII bacterium]|nr:site-specific DNA-methyltransferase [Clostridiales Family XIII bacterium]
SKNEALKKIPIPDKAVFFKPSDITSQGSATSSQKFLYKGKVYTPPPNSHWKAKCPEGMNRLAFANRIRVSGDNNLQYMRFADDFPYVALSNVWTDTSTGGFGDKKRYVVQTNTKVIERCILMATDPGDLVFDPTCGSGTTAQCAEKWARRWITCDTSRVALALTRTRMMTAKFNWFILSDSREGRQIQEAQLSSTLSRTDEPNNDVRKGFVYQSAKHITLKSIANNPDIVEGMKPSDIVKAIKKHAETQIFFDKPLENNKILRISGPFTVESLSPHRVLSLADNVKNNVFTEIEILKQNLFVTMILDNLSKSGIQNYKKNEHLKFDSIESFPNQWIHAAGKYTDNDGLNKRVAITIGPEHGTVGSLLIKEAAKQAVKGNGFDILIVCGFAFEPYVSEEITRYGKLNIIKVRMNPDMSMGNEFLKKTGTGNLFMVFGEPDIEILNLTDGRIIVVLNGVDVYDPTTGQIRSQNTDEIACWFIDSDYNEESFFTRHVYFTGNHNPYKNLCDALKADIDESAWNSLYSIKSKPFSKPKNHKIAVKVINHYGDEVLKVFTVS